ncbi:MAG: hypothetical protein DHS20C18_53650 [Saprospiraceae bacterium]|nr:MAG: hypothetical protein DHS20C18_53650 [Saprospiraceae bacterium]
MRRLFFCFILLLGSLSLITSCNNQASQENNAPVSEAETMSAANESDTEEPRKSIIEVDAVAFQNKMKEANVVLIDVRKPGEIENGKIENALEMDVTSPDFKEKMQALDREKTYLVYCASGMRSLRACNLMSENGFKNLYNLDGGYDAWTRSQEAQKQN